MVEVTNIAFAGLSLSALLCLLRIMRGSSLPDRAVALDSLLVVIAAGIATWVVRSRDGTYIDVLLIIAFLGFIGSVTAARFVERRGA